MLRAFRAAIGALVLVLPLSGLADTCSWLGARDRLLHVRANEATPVASVPDDDAKAIAMAAQDCGLWVLGRTHLRRLDASGAMVNQFALSAMDPRLARATHLAVDAFDGSLWLAGDKVLAHVSATGALLAMPAFDGVVRAMAVAADQGVWLLADKQLLRYGASGVPPTGVDLRQLLTGEPKQLAVDSIGGNVWVASNKVVLKVPASGAQSAGSVRSADAIAGIAVEPLSGRLWLAEGGTLTILESSGAVARTIPMASFGLGSAEAIAMDAAGQAVWVWTRDGAARIALDGTLLAFIPAAFGQGLAATQPFTVRPVLVLVEPPNDAITNNAQRTITLRYEAQCSGQPCDPGVAYFTALQLQSTLNGELAGSRFVFDPATRQASHTPSTRWPEGTNTLTAQLRDGGGNLSNAITGQFVVDTTVPVVSITAPAAGQSVNQPQVSVTGTVSEPANVLVNDTPATVTPAGAFSAAVALQEGSNTIRAVAVDRAANSGSAQVTVIRDTQPPAAPLASAITISTPSGGRVTITGGAAAVEAGSAVTVVNARTGASVTVMAAADGGFQAQLNAASGDTLNIAATDAAGNAGAPASLPIPGGLPPDPSTVATAVDPTVPTRVGASTAFLYSGAHPIQTGVAAGTIESRRAAVLRGRVITREGQPLPGVKVTIKDKPEFGQTFSREDGWFDMAVNGGGQVTLNYEGTGLLPVQRTVDTPWADWVQVPDAALIALDTRATRIDFSSGVAQAARSSAVTDANGTRQVTMVFPAGITASLLMPDGTSSPVTSLNVRATEYTVGAGGAAAMPAALPPTTDYTYAVELSGDEAIAAGAKSVVFSQPVPVYVDNFLGFPIGTTVPSGYYDRTRAAWVGSDNGRVISILSIEGGLAVLDVNGQGQPATAAHLARLGITDAERTQIATLFAPGKQVWRVPVRHFTPYDFNWLAHRRGIPTGCDASGSCVGQDLKPDPKSPEECGCIIEAHNQVLGETLPVPGTPYSLAYRSSRVPGYKGGATLKIPLTADFLPEGILKISLQVQVAGKTFTQQFDPALNLTHRFFWDGKDAYGRAVVGRHVAVVRIGYSFQSPWLITSDVLEGAAETAQRWGMPGALDGPIGSNEITAWATFNTSLDAPVPGTSQHMGGWGIDANHVYDAQRGLLMRGDGTLRDTPVLAVDTYTQPGVASWFVVPDLAMQADGSVLAAGGIGIFSTGANGGLRRITPTGQVTSLTGSLTAKTVTHRPGGEIYITGAIGLQGRDGIFSVNADGTLKPIAGVPSSALPTDPATAAIRQLIYPRRIAADREGNVYFTQQVSRQGSSLINDCRVRRVNLSGTISTIAGNGGCFGSDGDGGPALAAGMRQPHALTVDEAGNVYFSDGLIVRKVTAGGVITTVAGMGGNSGDTTDGRPATQVWLGAPNPTHQQPLVLGVQALTLDRAGDLLITTWNRVLRLGKDGILRTVVGSTTTTCAQTPERGAAALGACNRGLVATTVDPEGRLFVMENGAIEGDFVLRKIDPALPKEVQGEVMVASQDGSTVYVFDADGRHKRSLDAKLKANLLEFGYDASGRLLTLRDGDGNETRIERAASGTATGIVSPYGQRSTVGFDTNGYLERLTNPANESHTMAYTSGGLLTQFTRPRGGFSTYVYDVAGLLRQDRDAAGGGWDIVRNDETGEITMTSVEGRATRYRQIGGVERVVKRPDGIETHSFEWNDGVSHVVKPNGTRMLTEQGPDPRFGLQAPIQKRSTITLPSGLEFTQTATRTATTSGDLINLATQTDTVTINGKSWTTTFDAAQRSYTSVTPTGRQSIVRVDAKSRPVQSVIANVEPVNYAYDARGRLAAISQGTGVDKREATVAYDELGRVLSVTDPQGRSTGYTYDAANRVTRQTLPDGRFIGFTYDANGNVTSITPPGRSAHAFGYTPVDLENRYDPPAVPGIANPATTYAYDLDKLLTKVTRPDGLTIDIARDNVGRAKTVTTPTGVTQYTYSETTGELEKIVAPGGVELAYGYDGDLLKGETWSGPVAGSVSWTFDNFLDVQTIDIAGTRYGFTYDNDRRLAGVGDLTYGRRADNGFVASSQLGNVSTTQTYSVLGELEAFSAAAGGSAIFAQSFRYDNLGRLIGKTETGSGLADGYAYSYDAAGRLETVLKNGSLINTFTYDSNGNRTGDGVTTAAYDAQDRLVQFGQASYTYTDNGELETKRVGDELTRYEYDVRGNLRKVRLPDGRLIEYLIDGLDRRVGKKVDGALVQGFLYENQLRPVAEIDGAGNVRARFIFGEKMNVPEYMVMGSRTYRIISDHLGSVRLVVDSTSTEVVQRIDYDAFGYVTQDSNPGFQPFGFAGGVYSSDTELSRFGARDYDASTGRWTAKDPIMFNGGDANFFAYVGNDPLSFIDPTGLAKSGIPTKVGNSVVRVDKAHVPGQQTHAHVDPAKGGRGPAVNLDGTGSHGSTQAEVDGIPKKVKDFLRKKGFALCPPIPLLLCPLCNVLAPQAEGPD